MDKYYLLNTINLMINVVQKYNYILFYHFYNSITFYLVPLYAVTQRSSR